MSGIETGNRLLDDLGRYVCGSYPWGWSRKHTVATDNDAYDDDAALGELVDRRRIDKVGEELGEVIDAYGGYVGENPRKGVHDTREHVMEELLDVALSALGAWDHMAGHDGRAFRALLEHADQRHRRAGLAQ